MDYMDASRQPALQDAIYGLCITGTAYYKMQGAGSSLQYAMYSRCITGSMDYEMHVTGSPCKAHPDVSVCRVVEGLSSG